MPILLSGRACMVSPLPLYTYDELRALGYDSRSPRWMRLRKGVYVDRPSFARLPPWKRYEVRVHGFILTSPHAVLCLESAAVLHGIPLFGETKDVHVYAPGKGSSTRSGDVCIHTSADARDIVAVGGSWVTSVADTVSDLARVLPPAKALAQVDAVVSPAQGGTQCVEQLRAHSAGQQSTRGVRLRQWVWEKADPRSESPGESVSRAVILWSGFPQPVLQQKFAYEGQRDRCDFYFPESSVIGESDGWGKYDLDDPDAARRHLQDEKAREDRLRRYGHPVARWTAKEMWQVAPLCRALAQAGVRRIESPDLPFLATMRRSPREMWR